ncbi:MAG: aspartate kinase [Oscillospiraceae bacterium]|jgi:aspartate kinase|nr:aspartate kinase [Oscillospiraceae bacterium]
MSLIVKKFGGSSVADDNKLRNVARIVTQSRADGHQVVVVVSAQGDTTDDLLEKAAALNESASRREMDMLLACGEQMSAALLAITIEKMGCPVISLTGWQAGMQTDSNHAAARIKDIDPERVRMELDKHNIVVIAGFQGINKFGDVTTIGRGGSDTTAVAFAAALKADLCQIYTDVDGVFTADPRIVPDAKKLDAISFDEMLELASLGAQVLASRSVEMAKRLRVKLEVLSSFRECPGTIVKEVVKMENMQVSGVARDNNVARIALIGLKDVPGVAARVFSLLAQHKINVDIILQSIGRKDAKDISFTVAAGNLAEARALLEEHRESLDYEKLEVSDRISKVSAVGAGMVNNPGVAARMFEALAAAGINIQMISTSEIKVSVLIDLADSDRAVQVIHQEFFGG